MLINLRKKLACFISPEYRDEADEILVKGTLKLEKEKKEIDSILNQKVAETLLKMDPFEPLLEKFHGVFSEYYKNIEDRFDQPSKLRLYIWAYGQHNDPQAKYFSDYIMNTAGNAMVNLTNPTPERIGYFRSQIANEILRNKEIGRLSLHYEEIIKRKDEEFDSSVGVE